MSFLGYKKFINGIRQWHNFPPLVFCSSLLNRHSDRLMEFKELFIAWKFMKGRAMASRNSKVFRKYKKWSELRSTVWLVLICLDKTATTMQCWTFATHPVNAALAYLTAVFGCHSIKIGFKVVGLIPIRFSEVLDDLLVPINVQILTVSLQGQHLRWNPWKILLFRIPYWKSQRKFCTWLTKA